MTANSSRPPMIITHEGGMKFAAQVRSHRIVVDQPAPAGGADTGPMAFELLGVSLGTCVALYVQQFCQSRDIRCPAHHTLTQGARVTVHVEMGERIVC